MADWRNRIVGLEYHKPGEIADHPLQWRVHSTAQEAALRAVLSEVGIAGALLAYRNNGDLVAIDGHLRKSLDADAEWPVLLLDVTEDEANKLLATTDPLAAMAGADAAMLGDLLAVIETENDTLQALLDGLAEEHGIVAEEPPDDPGAQIDKAEELREKWDVELGQVWEIGEHRLVCGDCTDAAVVAAVMRGERAGAVVTDPPYGIEREGILNDDPGGLQALYDGCLAVLPVDDAVVIAFQSPRLFWVWVDAVRAAGHKVERLLWMYKPNDETFPWRGWLQTSEAIGVSSVGAGQWLDVHPYAHDCYSPTTLGAELPKEWGKSHASVKPIAVVEDLAARVAGDIYDPFLGSGTTLVACERLGRRGRGIELSPGYCAVSIQRLADMGLTPLLAGG